MTLVDGVSQPKVFVVIPNWNLKDDTIACVKSVLSSEYPLQRVIVVDNGSSDGSASAVANYFGENVALIVKEVNVGFAAGVNVGIQYALSQGADWVLLLNNDTLVAPDMIARLVAAAHRHPHLGILAPAIFCYYWPDRVWRLGDRHSRWMPIPFKISAKELRSGEEILPVDYVTGCGMFIRRQVFSVIGLFDPRYFMYYEDADFCRRAVKAGFSIACVPDAHMWHKVSGSTRGDVSLKYYWRTRSRVQFYRQHYTLPAWLFLIISTLWTMLVVGLKEDKKAMWACAKGFYRGWQLGAGINQPKQVGDGNSHL